MVSKKKGIILIGATVVAVISAMFVMGGFRSEFDKRLEEVSKISLILPVEYTVETYKDRSSLECDKIKLAISYVNPLEHWSYGWYSRPSWSFFKETLLNAIADGNFKGSHVFYHKDSRTMWFDTLDRHLASGTSGLGTTYYDAYLWVTIYITIE